MLPYDVRVIIFRHQAAFYDFSPYWEDCLYYIEDERLNEPIERKDVETFTEAFRLNLMKALSSNKSIIVIDYNQKVALGLWLYTEEIQKENPVRFFFLSFFHNDQITSNIIADFPDKTSSTEYLMDEKFKIIVSMIDFPFIKKYEIPIFFEISDKYLGGLIKDLI